MHRTDYLSPSCEALELSAESFICTSAEKVQIIRGVDYSLKWDDDDE